MKQLDAFSLANREEANYVQIPVIHGPGEVHEEEQRDVDRYAQAAVGEATVREANAGGLNELGRRGLVRVVTHKKSPPGAALELVSQHSSIHWDGRTGHVCGVLGGNKGDHVSDLLRCCQTLDGYC